LAPETGLNAGVSHAYASFRVLTLFAKTRERGYTVQDLNRPARKGKGRLMIWSRDRFDMLLGSAGRGMIYASTTLLALAVAVPFAMAQQSESVPKTSSKVQKTTQAAPPAGAPAAGDAPAPEDAWVKLCMKNEQTQNKQICLINHEGLEPNTGMVLIAAAVRQAEGEDKQQLLIRVPTAYALVIPAGVQIKIDDAQPIQLQYTLCFPTSCQVQMELTKEMFESMRKGKQMVVAAMNIQQKTMGFPVPLTGFAKAYDGPPVDNAKYEESRRQLMEVFRKRQEELAAKAAEAQQKKEAQQTAPMQGQAAAPANASAAPKKIAPPAQ
jgi:invasion protein IalB